MFQLKKIMISFYVLFAGLLLSACQPEFPEGDTYPQGVSLSSQQEVDVFGAQNYKYIDGYLNIAGDDITDLSPLSSIETVSRNLAIGYDDRSSQANGNPLLTSLNGLSNVVSVGEMLIVRYNYKLQNLDALSNLATVEDRITIQSNDKLTSISGLSSVTSTKVISVWNEDSLTSLHGLSGIGQVDYLLIGHNKLLPNLSGLNSNLVIDKGTTIMSNNVLVDYCALINADLSALSGTAFSVSDNAYNPSQADLSTAACRL